MSGLETLPPDQRAVLQLILVQGRGYADLAALLQLDAEAVRARARAAADALAGDVAAGADALPAEQRVRVTDYLLGQQEDGERIVTFAELAETDAACRWAQVLRERLTAFAAVELPAVPAAVSANGGAPKRPPTTSAQPAAAPTAQPASNAHGTQPTPAAQPAPRDGEPAPAPEPPPDDRPSGSASPRQLSRPGVAVVLAALVGLVLLLTLVVLDGGEEGGSPSAAAGTTTPSAQPAPRDPSATPAEQPSLVTQVNLDATPAGGEAVGIGIVQRSGRQLTIAIEAQRLPANGADDIYAVWLRRPGGAHFLGFVPRQVGADGSFTVSAELPPRARRFPTVLVTREGVTALPESPGEAILNGAMRL